MIKEALEDNMNMEALRSRRAKGKKLIYKIRNEKDEMITESNCRDRSEILPEVI